MTCPFCSMDENRVIFSNEHAYVIRDGFPVSPGHTLIIPKEHLASFFDLVDQQEASLLEALKWARTDVDQTFHPQGYNIGINEGSLAENKS